MSVMTEGCFGSTIIIISESGNKIQYVGRKGYANEHDRRPFTMGKDTYKFDGIIPGCTQERILPNQVPVDRKDLPLMLMPVLNRKILVDARKQGKAEV